MKKYIFSLSLALIGSALLSCGDEMVFFKNYVPGEGARVKFIHAASDTVGVNLFVDGTKITAGSPSTVTTAGSPNLGKVNMGTIGFVGSFPITNYTTVTGSSGNLSVVFPQVFNPVANPAPEVYNSKTLSTASASLSESGHYTIAFLGVSPSYETVVYEDDLSTAPLDGKVYIRFANFIHNSVDNLTLRATPPATTEDPAPTPVILFQNVPYKEMSNFIALERSGTYTNVQILNANTSAVIATLSAANSGWISNKVYTIFAHGRIGGTLAAAPGGSRMINR